MLVAAGDPPPGERPRPWGSGGGTGLHPGGRPGAGGPAGCFLVSIPSHEGLPTALGTEVGTGRPPRPEQQHLFSTSIQRRMLSTVEVSSSGPCAAS